MTEDYKKNLIDYLTNTLTNTTPKNTETIKENININRNAWLSFIPSQWNDFRYEGMVEGNELTSGLSVLYGGYLNTNNEVKGIITLVDEELKPVKTFYSFDTGTDLRYIQCMARAEDGSFYFIDDTSFSFTQKQATSTSEKRFVMINNITVPIREEYRAILRTSYIFPNNITNFYCKNMFKDPGSSNYIFFGSGASLDYGSNWDYDRLNIYGLKVNVGSANVWTTYVEQTGALFGSAIAVYDNESNVKFRCLWSSIVNTSRDIYCYYKTYTENPATYNVRNFGFHPYIDSDNYKSQCVFVDYDTAYYVQNNQRWGNTGVLEAKYIGLYKHDFYHNSNETIYEESLGNYDFCSIKAIYLAANNGKLYIQYVDNIDNNEADYHIQRYDGVWNPILIGETKKIATSQRTLYVKNNFNYLQIYSYTTNPRSLTWYMNLCKEDYNPSNYNGDSYVDEDVLVPKKANLYSYYPNTEDLQYIFGRNLYNVSKQNNMTMSSVEIPANYLNNSNIQINDLISENNLKLVNNNKAWNKNQYEVVDLNFLNTINVIDEDTSNTYLEGAIKINQATTDGGSTNYQNAPCNKYRINYQDSTTSTGNITWTSIDDTHKEANISIYADKAITNIDLISYDGTSIYLTINGNFEINKYYTINQKVRVE